MALKLAAPVKDVWSNWLPKDVVEVETYRSAMSQPKELDWGLTKKIREKNKKEKMQNVERGKQAVLSCA